MRKSFFITVFIFILNVVQAQTSNSYNSVDVDLSSKGAKKESVLGFLHFNELEPLQKDIDILKPKFWRFGAKLKENTPKRKQQVDILIKNNITPIITLSDIYDEEHWYKDTGGWVRPSDDPTKFTNMVKNLYRELGSKVIFDVWNEPNAKEVWGGTRLEFFKTVKVAHDALRSSPNGDKALLTGPSISAYDKVFITEFLDYCNSNNIQLDYLNWHDLGTQTDAIKLQDNIREAKELLKKYPKLKVKDILIPEIVGIVEQFNPLTPFAYAYSLEKANATGGCKACWENPNNPKEISCWNNSMDGILTSTGKPRSAWWFYKYYANSLEKRLPSISFNRSIIHIAYYNENNDFGLLLGNLSPSKVSNFKLNLKNNIDISRLQNKTLKLYEIPDSNDKELSQPILVATKSLTIKGKNSSVNLGSLKKKTLYYAIISK